MAVTTHAERIVDPQAQAIYGRILPLWLRASGSVSHCAFHHLSGFLRGADQLLPIPSHKTQLPSLHRPQEFSGRS